MTTTAPVSTTAQRAWGIGAVVVEIVAIVPALLTLLLAITVDANYGWLMLIAIPIVVVGGLLGMLAGIVGIIYAGIRRRAFVWPIVGIVLGVVLVAALSLILGLGSV
ncbi:hypothetical protein [Microbacterium dauci]|uniref:Major facilitator superfamily (MFS) profile domain-containing protein n=1 Tax=Microbacterium dauci TaxID=3048008 RepID=A0ABT6ZF25_9MICO|nr:hypothetical protein [Microbacterium sp. LX3-4]MDJ1114773.1 hypothetical protein [Microbacterium sp. LX3-4]